MIQLTGQVVPAKLNAEKGAEDAAKKYEVRGFPTILFLSPNGAVVGRITGYEPPASFARDMQRIVQNARDAPLLEARLKAEPKDADASARLAAIVAQKGDIARAEQLLGTARAGDAQNKRQYLATALNAVADYYQEHTQFDRAIGLFREATRVGRTPQDIAYAHVSIATCFMSQGKTREAAAEYRATLGVQGCPPDLKQIAQQKLRALTNRR